MAYVKYDPMFWWDVSVALHEQFGLHGEETMLDGETLYVLARTVELGCNSSDEGLDCWIGKGTWTPEYTADRLHRKLGLR